jgi:hypothetical protein
LFNRFLHENNIGITQYSEEVDEKWKYLLLPGMKITAKVLWMYDEVIFVRLIAPSERDVRALVELQLQYYKSNSNTSTY